MGRTSRRRHKHPKPLNIKQGEDRISNLPDALIGHNLSFLPTKYAVATSVLSTKWKELWTLTTSLDFDDSLLRDPPSYRTSPHLKTSFMNFVDRVLQQCQSPRNIHFKWSSSYKCENVEKLSLVIPTKQHTTLPRHLFRKETLVELKLESEEFVMDISESVWLPRLKVLKLDSVKFLDDSSLTSLLCGCPLLEKLSLTRFFNEDVGVIHICAPVLTSLELYSQGGWEEPSYKEIKMVVDTPMLSDLIMQDYLYECYEFKNLNHLKKARISLQDSIFESPPADRYSHYSKVVYDIYEAVSGVEILLLDGESMEAIEFYKSRLPIFQHLTKLIFCSPDCYQWRVLPLLLEKSPHLRTLTFLDGLEILECNCSLDEHLFHDESCYQYTFCPKDCVPDCLVHHLKRIELGDFEGNDKELYIINYFLENARVLEKLAVHPQDFYNSEELDVISKELLMLPRPSGCQIEFFKTTLRGLHT